MYFKSIITLLTWPVLIAVSYLLVMLALKKLEKKEAKTEEPVEL